MSKWIWIIILFFFATINFVPPFDTDFGWHYRCGKELLERHPCLNNTFSYYLADYQAYYASFLSDALTAWTYNVFGFTGISILQSTIIVLIAYVFISHSKQHPAITSLSFLAVNLLAWPIISIGWRPQMLSLLFVFLLYVILKSYLFEKKTKYLSFIPLLMAFWVNTHMGFFTGILLLFFACSQKSIEIINVLLARKKHDRVIKHIPIDREILIIFVVAIASIAATFLNPFGWNVYLEIIRHIQSPLNEMIAEWTQPLFFHQILIGILAVVFAILSARNKNYSLFSFLTILFFAYAAITARRNLPIYYLFVFFELASLVPRFELKWIRNNTFLFLPLIGAIIIAASFFSIKKTMSVNLNWNQYCTKGMALLPCEFVKKYPHLKGNIFTAYEYGGFLVWQIPQANIFIDGRMPAWSDHEGISPYKRFLAIVQTQPGWNEKLDKYHTDYILINKGTFLELLLKEKSAEFGWQIEYENTSHALYKKISQ